MKYADEWGSGHPELRCGESSARNRRLEAHGASGTVLGGGDKDDQYCLKIVPMPEDASTSGLFWEEARSVSVYTSVARNIPGCAACPLPACYWIWEEDPLYENLPRKGMSKEHLQTLIDYISLFDVKPEQLTGIDPATYWFAPPSLLKTIHEKKLPARLLMTYPVLRGGPSLRDQPLDDPQKVRKMIGNILWAILLMYIDGLAHGDVKPANIVRERDGNGYFLADVGSVHSGSHPSDSGTEVFFKTNVFKIWQNELESGKLNCQKQNEKLMGGRNCLPKMDLPEDELNSLLRRTLMDGYALAVTIWSMAYGREPTDQWGVLNLDWVNDRWHCDEITDIFNTLFDVEKLTIVKMIEMAKGVQPVLEYFPASPRILTYGKESEIGFDVEWRETVGDKTEVQYGKLSEQLNFSGKFNPMVRFYGDPKADFFPEGAVLQPVIETRSNGGKTSNTIFYAPDDAESRERLVDFENYHPCTLAYLLEHDELTEEDIDELLNFGRQIDTARAVDKKQFGNLRWVFSHDFPYPHDIVKVDDTWVIQPFFLKGWAPAPAISFEEYFKMLCGRDNKLSSKDWVDLLCYDYNVGVLFELIPEKRVRSVAKLLNAKGEERWLREKLRKTKKFGKYLSAE